MGRWITGAGSIRTSIFRRSTTCWPGSLANKRQQIGFAVTGSDQMARAYALTADENGRFPEAAAAYEASLLADPSDLEATLNLVVLYWRVADQGVKGLV